MIKYPKMVILKLIEDFNENPFITRLNMQGVVNISDFWEALNEELKSKNINIYSEIQRLAIEKEDEITEKVKKIFIDFIKDLLIE